MLRMNSGGLNTLGNFCSLGSGMCTGFSCNSMFYSLQIHCCTKLNCNVSIFTNLQFDIKKTSNETVSITVQVADNVLSYFSNDECSLSVAFIA